MKFCRYFLILITCMPLSVCSMEPSESYFDKIKRGVSFVRQALKQEKTFECPDMMLFPEAEYVSFEDQWKSLMRRFKTFDKLGVRKTIILVDNEYYDLLVNNIKKSKRISVHKAGDFLPEGVLVAFGFYRQLSARL